MYINWKWGFKSDYTVTFKSFSYLEEKIQFWVIKSLGGKSEQLLIIIIQSFMQVNMMCCTTCTVWWCIALHGFQGACQPAAGEPQAREEG